jgi:hypothetical protein
MNDPDTIHSVLKSPARQIILIFLFLVFIICDDAVLSVVLPLSDDSQSSRVGRSFNEALDSIRQVNLIRERHLFSFRLDVANEKEGTRGR